MREIVFATNNEHKLKEIKKLLLPNFNVLGLREKGIQEDIPEDHFTLQENAYQKAEFILSHYGISCFADDTGLEIEALDGEPGVFSARYSRMGDPMYPNMDVTAGNINKVLEKLEGQENRKARFRTVIALILDGNTHYFDGKVEGCITDHPGGIDGFGYDPIFQPVGYMQTFAEMSIEEKNLISHRAIAVSKLVDFLNKTKLL
jgi:XTP/dITP diphosphohydrolase